MACSSWFNIFDFYYIIKLIRKSINFMFTSEKIYVSTKNAQIFYDLFWMFADMVVCTIMWGAI